MNQVIQDRSIGLRSWLPMQEMNTIYFELRKDGVALSTRCREVNGREMVAGGCVVRLLELELESLAPIHSLGPLSLRTRA